jgi:acid phosphatase family membrane protein YuiD
MFPFNIVIIPLIVFVAAQGTKFLTKSVHGLNWHNISAYGGMPSSHTAITVSMATLAGLVTGFNSIPFMIALVLTVIIIRDAMGFRMNLSEQGRVLNQLVKKMDGVDRSKYPSFDERLGHTGWEVFVGVLFGVLITWGLYLILV